ncbi:ADAM 12 protein [Micromonospora sp. NPDC049679]|uniref:ADAM 12 protein n=1 Tax=Micromonospora sp. NPDC049679 TaxID=3155920 RepID=UPI0033DD83A1
MAKTRRQSETAPPGQRLSQLAGAGETGTLYVDGDPGGTVHLMGGVVTYVGSPAAPGVGALLTASGRLPEHTWRASLEAGRDVHRVGRILVEQGHLMQGELELCVLGAVYDAAFFVLTPAAVPVRFVPGELHWLGRIVDVEAAALQRETDRRRRVLEEIRPGSAVDHAPITPVARPPVQRVVLTAAQWELVVHADGRRTAADLSELLGRPGYATLQELRRLSAAGLLRDTAPPADGKPDPQPSDRDGRSAEATPADPATLARRTPPSTSSMPADTERTGPAAAAAGGAEAAAAPASASSGPASDGARRSTDPASTGGKPRARTGAATQDQVPPPRRRQHAAPPAGAANDAGPNPGPPDDALLDRIRAALKALR